MNTVLDGKVLEFLVSAATSATRTEPTVRCLVQVEGVLWYGNFLKYEKHSGPYIETDYTFNSRVFLFDDSERAKDFLSCLHALPNRIFQTNVNDNMRFEKAFFESNNVLRSHQFVGETSNSFLYDVESIDGTLKLPFIHLPDKIHVLAVVEKG